MTQSELRVQSGLTVWCVICAWTLFSDMHSFPVAELRDSSDSHVLQEILRKANILWVVKRKSIAETNVTLTIYILSTSISSLGNVYVLYESASSDKTICIFTEKMTNDYMLL